MSLEITSFKEAPLEMIDGDRGKNYPKQDEFTEDGFCLFLNAKNVTDNGFNFETKMFISQEKDEILKKGKLQRGDVILTTRGTVGNVAFYSEDIHFDNIRINSGMLILRSKSELSNKFLYYVLKSDFFKKQIYTFKSGTAQPQLPISSLNHMKFYLPKINIQKKIVTILSNIDIKIKVLEEINKNLLKLSKYLYKEFYMDKVELYSDKEYVTLDEVTSKFATGLNPRKNFVLGEGNNYYVTIKNMVNNSIVLDDKCASITDEALIKINKRSDLKVGDLLFSGIGTIGRVHLIDENPTNWNISESVFTMRPNDLVSSEFLFIMLLSQEVQEYAKTLASGSVQKGIRMRDLKAFEFVLPKEEDKSILDSLLIPIIADIKSNEKESVKFYRLLSNLIFYT